MPVVTVKFLKVFQLLSYEMECMVSIQMYGRFQCQT
jgi:hypothetical protein